MKLLKINDILRHTYGLREIRSIKNEKEISYSFKTKYSETQFTGTLWIHEVRENADNITDEEIFNDTNNTDNKIVTQETNFSISFNEEPVQREKELLKLIASKFEKENCFVSFYNNSTETELEI